ncbi:MAG: ferrous iron transport protein A [Clostridia bacterium]|nr:ferrous iron transport protein A [Clostridia bacterium]
MNLSEVKLNTKCIVKAVKVKDEKTKIRLMELGLIEDCEIVVNKKSALKKTLLVIFAHSCFTLKDNLAREIEVEYA